MNSTPWATCTSDGLKIVREVCGRGPRCRCGASTPRAAASSSPHGRRDQQKYADVGAVSIDSVGHYPMLEKPDELIRKLRNALKELATKT
jgi:pimeloyl-ACP methyl ester carboxylesterase